MESFLTRWKEQCKENSRCLLQPAARTDWHSWVFPPYQGEFKEVYKKGLRFSLLAWWTVPLETGDFWNEMFWKVRLEECWWALSLVSGLSWASKDAEGWCVGIPCPWAVWGCLWMMDTVPGDDEGVCGGSDPNRWLTDNVARLATWHCAAGEKRDANDNTPSLSNT